MTINDIMDKYRSEFRLAAEKIANPALGLWNSTDDLAGVIAGAMMEAFTSGLRLGRSAGQ